MLLTVTFVGTLIHIYSTGYMAHEGGYYRFFSYLNLFMFFMLTLVLAANIVVMFVGWEGVGLCSYLLIGFWFLKQSAISAGKKAFITTRIGDFGFTIGILLLFWTFRSVDFGTIFSQVSNMPSETMTQAGVLTTICILLFTGAVGKSAQLPLYVWLPDAMEGPTPVSALIHAATMVTAGVYMVARMHPLFSRAPIAMLVVAIVGAATAFYSATIGLVQTDIKKVLAYSTVSQLGYMFLACGVGAYAAGIFHLMTHAFFKGLLFLCAGSVIHAMGGEQDMRKMGGLRKAIPVTFWTMFIATFAISGVPGFAGFFSKDEILEAAHGHANGPLWLLGLVAAGLTSFYMFRLIFLTFFGETAIRRAQSARPRIAAQHDDSVDNSRVSLDFRRMVGCAQARRRHKLLRRVPASRVRFLRTSSAPRGGRNARRLGGRTRRNQTKPRDGIGACGHRTAGDRRLDRHSDRLVVLHSPARSAEETRAEHVWDLHAHASQILRG